MQATWGLLLCVLFASAHRTFYTPFANHKRSISNQKIFDEDITAHDGLSYHRLKWNGHIKDEVVSLDEEEGIDKVDCGPTYLSLTLSESLSSSSKIKTGSILVGGLRVFCISEEGDELPFYRRVEKVVSQSPTQLLVYTRDVGVLDCFHRIDMVYEKSPPSADVSKKRFTDELSWDLFSFNYNRETQGANTSFLPIFTLGDEQTETTGQDSTESNSLTEFEVNRGLIFGCRDCYAVLTAGFRITVVVDERWGFPPVKLSHLKIEPFGTFTMNITAELHSWLRITASKETALTPEFPLPTIPLSLGNIPLWITPHLSLRGRIDFELEASATLTTGYYYRSEMSAGIEYRDEWGQFRQFSNPVVQNFQYRPPVLQLEGKAEASLFLIPRIGFDLKSLLNGRVNVDFEPYIGATVTMGSNSGCSSLLVPHYQLFGGLDLKVSLAKLAVNLAVTDYDISEHVGLPKSFTKELIPRYDFQCQKCSGCIDIFGADEYYYWDVSDFSNCSVTCGEGTQTRSVTCRSSSGQPHPDSDCLSANIGPKPSTSQTCHMLPCESPCTSATTCSSCLGMSQCGWCATSSSCLSVVNAGTCADWRGYSCNPSEQRINIASPTATTVWDALSTVTVSWTGGSSQVLLRLKLGNLWIAAGVGLPEGPIANTGSYQWHITNVFSENDYQIAIISNSDLSNFGESDPFTIRSASDVWNWYIGEWGLCSRSCGGIQTREVTCRNTFGMLDALESHCLPPKPATSQSCGSLPPVTDCACVLNPGESPGGFETCRSPTIGVCPEAFCCNQCINYCSDAHWRYTTSNCTASCGGGTRTAKCQSNVNYLCYGVAYPEWKRDGYCDPELNVPGCWDGGDCCPQTCEDGEYQCGYNGYDCRDPEVISGAQPTVLDCEESNCYYNDGQLGEQTCNNFPCVTYSYIVTEWGNCTKLCGQGMQYREFSCMSSAGHPVDISYCPSPPPATQQSCATAQCIDYPIEVLSEFSVHSARDRIEIAWSGGKEDDTVSISLIIGQNAPIVLADSVPTLFRIWDWYIFPYVNRSTSEARIKVTSSHDSNNYGLSNKFTIRSEQNYVFNFTTGTAPFLEFELAGTFGTFGYTMPPFPMINISALLVDLGELYSLAVRSQGGAMWSGTEVTVLDTYRGHKAEFGIHQSVGAEWVVRYDCSRFVTSISCTQYDGCYWSDVCTSRFIDAATSTSTTSSSTTSSTSTSTTSSSTTSSTSTSTIASSSTTSSAATSTTSTSSTTSSAAASTTSASTSPSGTSSTPSTSTISTTASASNATSTSTTSTAVTSTTSTSTTSSGAASTTSTSSTSTTTTSSVTMATTETIPTAVLTSAESSTTGVLRPNTSGTTESDVTTISSSSQLKAAWMLLLVAFVLCLQQL